MDEFAQVADSARLLPGIFGNLHREALFERTLQLDQAKAVEADILAEAALVGEIVHAGAGHRA